MTPAEILALRIEIERCNRAGDFVLALHLLERLRTPECDDDEKHVHLDCTCFEVSP